MKVTKVQLNLLSQHGRSPIRYIILWALCCDTGIYITTTGHEPASRKQNVSRSGIAKGRVHDIIGAQESLPGTAAWAHGEEYSRQQSQATGGWGENEGKKIKRYQAKLPKFSTGDQE